MTAAGALRAAQQELMQAGVELGEQAPNYRDFGYQNALEFVGAREDFEIECQALVDAAAEVQKIRQRLSRDLEAARARRLDALVSA